jgi:hypothetical protein
MENTLKRTPLIAIALLVATNVAFAQSKHPADMAARDAAMQTAKLTPTQRAEVSGIAKKGNNCTTPASRGALR